MDISRKARRRYPGSGGAAAMALRAACSGIVNTRIRIHRLFCLYKPDILGGSDFLLILIHRLNTVFSQLTSSPFYDPQSASHKYPN